MVVRIDRGQYLRSKLTRPCGESASAFVKDSRVRGRGGDEEEEEEGGGGVFQGRLGGSRVTVIVSQVKVGGVEMKWIERFPHGSYRLALDAGI